MQRGTLGSAYADQDWDVIRDYLMHRSDRVDGCWIWNGPKNKVTGYGQTTTSVNGKQVGFTAHRLAAAVANRRPLLGPEVVHHKCSVRLCCNPDHLQLVTQADNLAEMLERRSYTARITALEDALREVSPGHPLLT